MRTNEWVVNGLVGLLLVLTVPCAAQTLPDSTAVPAKPESVELPRETVRLAADTTVAVDSAGPRIKKPWPNPSKAGYLSLALPGAGQIYNKDYWKLPLVYGAIGGSLLVALNRADNYRFWDELYDNKARATIDTAFALTWDPIDPYPDNSPEEIQRVRDSFRRQRDFWYFMAGVSYVLNAVEAYVAAHLKDFDVSDDLSMRIEPSMQPHPTLVGLGIAPTIGVTFTLH